MDLPEEALGSRGAVGTTDMKVVDSGEGAQFAITEAVTTVVIKGQVAVAAFHAGTAALEQIGAAPGDLLDACAKGGREGL